MLTALAPFWLYLFPPVLAIGVVALWRGRHFRHRVSSTLLWRGLESQAAGSKSRLIDPLWAMVLAAALLATLALPHPMVQMSANPPSPAAEMLVAMRGLRGTGSGELYVRAVSQENLPARLRLELASPAKDVVLPGREVTPGELTAGVMVGGIPAVDHVDVRLMAGGRAIGAWSLDRVTRPPFALLTLGPVSPALRRVMAIQPGATVGDLSLRPAVYLIDDPGFSVGQLAPPAGSVVIASARTPLEGITFLDGPASRPATGTAPAGSEPGAAGGATVPAGAGGAVGIPQVAGNSALLDMSPGQPIVLRDVRVLRYRRVRLSDGWMPLMTVNGQPWVALRREDAGGGGRGGGEAVTWIYLASRMAPAETNWFGDPSFVFFFSNVAGQLGPAGAGGAAGLGAVEEWRTEAVAVAGTGAATPRRYDLAPWLAGSAALLVLAAAALFVRRGRR